MKSLSLNYVHSAGMGYGRLGVRLHQAFTDAGITVYDDMGEPPDWYHGNPERAENLASRTTAPSPTNMVCWVSVPAHAKWWYEGQYTSMFTMWEAMTLPEGFRENLYEFDTVIVPSVHNQELFSRYHDNVHFVPLGVDTSWTYRPRLPVDRYFNFLIGGSGKRKGTDLAFNAFRTVFPDPQKMSPQPRLMMKNPRREDFYGANIEVIGGKISADAELDLYGQAHCYLQPSRGEGFGLQPLQAIAQGCPTILTAAHGHGAFAHLGIPLDSKPVPTDPGSFMYGEAGDWWEPDFEQLCEAMHDVYHNYTVYEAVSLEASKRAHREFTWARTVEKLCAIWGDQLTKPYTGEGFHRSEAKLFPITVDRPYKCDIADELYFFTPGKTFYVPADVKRALYDADVLDPACLTEDDAGLLNEQIERLGYYRAAHQFCPTCHQQLNTQPTKADAHEAGLL